MLKTHYIKKIPPCPYCHSNRTGRFISIDRPARERVRIVITYLRHGEYVRIRRPGEEDYTVFCLDCNNAWYEYLQGEWLSGKELREYKEEKQAQNDEELLNKLLAQEREFYKHKEHKLLKRMGRAAKDATKFAFKHLVYEPTIGTVRDTVQLVTGPKDKNKDKVKEQAAQKAHEPTFEDLYNEFCVSDKDSQDQEFTDDPYPVYEDTAEDRQYCAENEEETYICYDNNEE